MSDLQSKIVTQDLLERSASQPIYLSSIEVVGGETFSNSFFKKLLSPLTDNSDYTLGQLLKQVELSHNRLMKTDVFQKVDVSFHSDYVKQLPKVESYNREPSIPTKVVFDLSTLSLNVGEGFLNLNSDDILSVNLNYLNNNFLQNAEIVNLGVNYNPYKPNQHLISNGKVSINLPNPSFKLISDFHNTNSNNQVWQQLSEHTSGLFSGLMYTSESKKLQTMLGLGVAKRTLHDIDDAASDDLKFFGGEFLKKSIVHQIRYKDLKFLNEITNNFPINGFTLDILNEVSTNDAQGPVTGSSVSSTSEPFLKSGLSTNIFKSFFNNKITTHLSFDLGGIFAKSASASSTSVHTSDRFYLGGFNSFRGFTKNSLNQEGGYQFYKLSATVYSQLPTFLYKPHHLIRLEDGHGFEANPLRLYATGNVGSVTSDGLKLNAYGDANVATSAGFGLRYFNNWANFDVGYFVANRLNDSSVAGIKDGFQFSVSIGGSNRVI